MSLGDARESRPSVRLLVTDLDNTLWDWFDAWYRSFTALLIGVEELTGVPRETLLPEIRAVHRARGTSEYTLLLDELPTLKRKFPGKVVSKELDEALHRFYRVRKDATKLYSSVRGTLLHIQNLGVPIVGYTQSLSFFCEWRIKQVELDGVISVLYSAPDHDFPTGVRPEDIRTLDASEYGLKRTRHEHVPRGLLKPDPRVLQGILAHFAVDASEVVYVGDSLMKDVAMAQDVGAIDVLAAYGAVSNQEAYELLRNVSHWTQADVDRERRINLNRSVRSTYTIDRFADLLRLFDFRGA